MPPDYGIEDDAGRRWNQADGRKSGQSEHERNGHTQRARALGARTGREKDKVNPRERR